MVQWWPATRVRRPATRVRRPSIPTDGIADLDVSHDLTRNGQNHVTDELFVYGVDGVSVGLLPIFLM